jgi:nicotinate-nucleotide adenylyltransferase
MDLTCSPLSRGERGGRGGEVLGVFGGTFDPPHYGHLAAAEEAAEVFGLPRVLFVPTGQPPHKPGAPVTPASHRVRMTALAIADNPRFALSRVDVDRPGPSYTADLLALLHAEHGVDTEVYFICGMDMLASFLTWHEPARVIAQCQLVALTRPGYTPVDVAALERALPEARGRVHLLHAPGLDIAGTDLRARVAVGRSVRYLVPPPVAAYVREHGLYGARAT